MSKPSKRLGRGLDSLISNLRTDAPTQRPTARVATGHTMTAQQRAVRPPPTAAGEAGTVAIDDLTSNPFQPRDYVTEESLTSLAESLRASGMIQPISVRLRGGRLEIIAGERRWAAARMAGMKDVPVIVRQADDRQMLEMALVENIQREDLNAVDRARGYRQYCDDFGATVDELARRLGEDRTTVTNYLRLLDLPEEIKQWVAAGRISMGHARCIVGVADDEMRLRLGRSVIANELSVRALESLVRRAKRGQAHAGDASSVPADKTPHLLDLEQRCATAIGTKVTIQEGRRRGTGHIQIEYYSLDDFERIMERLGVKGE